jgi:hypothetical protein
MDDNGKVKYKGLINTMQTVYKEEGGRKLLLSGIHPRFMFNLMNGFLFLFVYERFMEYSKSIYN